MPFVADHVESRFTLGRDGIDITCAVQTDAKAGVEMEALAGVSVAALTLYEVCKAVDKAMRIEGIRGLEKIKQSSPPTE